MIEFILSLFIFAIICFFISMLLAKKNKINYTDNSSGVKQKANPTILSKHYLLPNCIEDNKELYSSYDFEVVGSKYTHFGNNGQDGIESLKIGDTVILKPDPNNKKDSTAVAVFNNQNLFCGWLPADNYVDTDEGLKYTGKISTFNKLTKNTPMRAIVINKYISDDDFNFSIKIAVGFYKTPKKVEISEFENECLEKVKKILQDNQISLFPLRSTKTLKYLVIDYKVDTYYKEILRIGTLKKYSYVLIQKENEISKIKEKSIQFENAPNSEGGIRVILNSPTDINEFADIILNKIR